MTRQFIQTRDELYDTIITRASIPKSRIVVATAFSHTATYYRAQLIKRITHGEIAMKGINQLILKNGTRIYINSASDTSLLGMRTDLVAIDEVMHLNIVNMASFIGNCLKVSNDVIVTDEKITERAETLQVFGFEGI